MRPAILSLLIIAILVTGCGQPRKPKAARPEAAAKAVTAAPAKPASKPPAPRPPVPHAQDDLPRHSPLDEIASMAAEAAKPKSASKPAPIAPPTSDRWLVVSVHDGDTVLCLDADNVQHKVRIVGIDAPEIGQPFGTTSRDGLREMVLRKSVTVHEAGEDKYGRTLGSLEIDGHDVALQMLLAGLAWQFTRYSDDEHLAAAEREARAARRGLWADPKPVPPWEWRASEKDRKSGKREPAGR